MKRYIVLLAAILILGLFLRTYKMIERFGYAHDGDLYSWIVKDVVVNHHFRLIGQLTSNEGIFIGPLFYYLLIPFYLLFKMDPVGSAYFPPLIALFTILSYWFVFSKLFNKQTGLIAAFLHAFSWSAIGFDRWMVPTIPTKLWAIWYLYTIILISRGKFFTLPLLGLLIGLIWNIHLALLPALLAVPAALILAKKIPSKKQILLFLLTLFTSSSPLILFELRHNFIQLKSLLASFNTGHGGGDGLFKLQAVWSKISNNISSFLLSPANLPEIYRLVLTGAILLSVILLIRLKLIKIKEAAVLIIWILGVILYFSFSSIIASEYYFANLEVIFVLIISLLLFALFKSSALGKYFIISMLTLWLVRNFYLYMTYQPYHVGLVERKAIAEYIKKDSVNKNFPCVAINYITMPGENVGFRYLFYLQNLKLAKPSNKVPVYSIVFPYEWSKNEVTQTFGHMGVIQPNKIPPPQTLKENCAGPNTNLTDSMFGYVE